MVQKTETGEIGKTSLSCMNFNGLDHFEESSRDEAFDGFLNGLVRNAQIRAITISNVALSVEVARRLEDCLDDMDNLQELSFANISFINEQEGARNTMPLFRMAWRTRRLTISSCNFSSDSSSGLGNMFSCSETKRLMDPCTFDPPIGSTFAPSFPTLSSLTLNQSNVFATSCRLKEIILQDSSLDKSHASCLAGLLSMSSSLEFLDLDWNNLCGDSVKCLVQDGLRQNKTLKRLSLSGNPIGDEGCRILVDFLQEKSCPLTRIRLIECDIWSRGWIYLARGLRHMRNLEHLVLGGDEIDDHVDVVLASMRFNTSLQSIATTSIRCCDRENTSKEWKEIDFYLHCNRVGRRLLLDEGTPPSMWATILAKSRENPSVLFHFLRNKRGLTAYAQQH